MSIGENDETGYIFDVDLEWMTCMIRIMIIPWPRVVRGIGRVAFAVR